MIPSCSATRSVPPILPGCQKEFGYCVRREIFRCGPHDNERPITLKGHGFSDSFVVTIDHRKQCCLHERKIRSARGGRREFKTSGGHPWQCSDHSPPRVWEVVKRRVEFDALNLSTARREGLRYPLQALAVRGRQSALGDGLDGSHVGQSGRYTTREGAIPTRLIPLFPPIEEGARDVDRINFKRAVEETVRR